MRCTALLLTAAGVLGLGICSCSYPHYAGPLRPGSQQDEQMAVADDGTVTFTKERLEISLRPMSDEELDRRFATPSQTGATPGNPYTFAGADVEQYGQRPQRFTVFLLKVKNYAYPKVRLDPARVVLRTDNGREYWSLGLQQLDSYFRAYAIGFRGNAYSRYQSYLDQLVRTMFADADIFSGQEAEGYLIFPALHPDVKALSAQLLQAHLRFDFANQPVETIQVSYRFARDTGRMTPQGVQLDQ